MVEIVGRSHSPVTSKWDYIAFQSIQKMRYLFNLFRARSCLVLENDDFHTGMFIGPYPSVKWFQLCYSV